MVIPHACTPTFCSNLRRTAVTSRHASACVNNAPGKSSIDREKDRSAVAGTFPRLTRKKFQEVHPGRKTGSGGAGLEHEWMFANWTQLTGTGRDI
eukprot:1138698-Pleurochrysis_carterae.AAC.2